MLFRILLLFPRSWSTSLSCCNDIKSINKFSLPAQGIDMRNFILMIELHRDWSSTSQLLLLSSDLQMFSRNSFNHVTGVFIKGCTPGKYRRRVGIILTTQWNVLSHLMRFSAKSFACLWKEVALLLEMLMIRNKRKSKHKKELSRNTMFAKKAPQNSLLTMKLYRSEEYLWLVTVDKGKPCKALHRAHWSDLFIFSIVYRVDVLGPILGIFGIGEGLGA